MSTLDQALTSKTRSPEVSLSAFGFLFAQVVSYSQSKSESIPALEKRLEELGAPIGESMLELLFWRERSKREVEVTKLLLFIQNSLWKSLFGRAAHLLEKSTEVPNQYQIWDNDLLVDRFISIPKDMSSLNCGAFVAGIVRGAVSAAGFPAAVFAASADAPDGSSRKRTAIIVRFEEGFDRK